MSHAQHFQIAADHPALPGHFPGAPVVPGVVILERVAQLAGVNPTGVRAVKFLHPLLPEQVCEVQLQKAVGSLRFKVLQGAQLIAEGTFASA